MTTLTKPSLNIDSKLLSHWNKKLASLKPEEILEWSILTFPGLYQTTAFGLTGLCIIDMLSKLNVSKNDEGKYPVELVFVDTLYHFPQTLDLVKKIEEKYPSFKLHIYKPDGCENDTDFVNKYGDQLWETDELKYDYLVKVEPLKRAYEDLGIMVVFTGRRRSQGSNRAELPIIEIDETLKVIKINPLASYNFIDVKKYIDENQVPYNELLDLGYKSVGDWHSTEPVAEGEDERSGRWKGKAKTECGIHVSSNYSQFIDEKKEESK
ncbi:3'-phosphoadenylsulfate reductase [Pichia californica]|uniref:3'-phosphoadenylsulfate reductase n=1 Tax=Pichia californica TaxID=460514 RepID=A0A9P6WNB0_9ASCO|nr:3'-phosphoadenylsulfate reductase [[Candida] californica]KAG0690130.1 3'-phosphoadenylsulfate reductase [[Candida] californica]